MIVKRIQGTAVNKFLEKYETQILEVLESTTLDKRRTENLFTLLYMKEYLLSKNYTSFQLKLATPDYYTWKLAQRTEFLGSLTTDHLCKSMIMENKKHNEDPVYQR